MGRQSPALPTRPRSDRARRRVIFCAESLETRQLLSVAAYPPAIAPAVHAPAQFGPVVPSATGNTGSSATPAGSSSAATPTPEIIIPITEQITSGGIAVTFLIIDVVPASSGASSPAAPTSGGSTSTTGSAASPTSANPSVTSPTPAITPLTQTILSTGNANAAPIIVITPQPTVANFAPSSIPVTTQAILATAAQEEQPIGPPVLGQGFESGQTQGIDPAALAPPIVPNNPVPLKPQIPAVDFIEPVRPAPVNPPAGQPEQPEQQPQPTVPALPPGDDQVDVIPVEPAALTDWGKSPRFPILSPRADDVQTETPSWSMAAVVGTAVIAGGGYHLVLGGSNRFNQRWLPTRRPSRETRGRKSVMS
jgi:hypothetical protein